jgi:hypothetical protein
MLGEDDVQGEENRSGAVGNECLQELVRATHPKH